MNENTKIKKNNKKMPTFILHLYTVTINKTSTKTALKGQSFMEEKLPRTVFCSCVEYVFVSTKCLYEVDKRSQPIQTNIYIKLACYTKTESPGLDFRRISVQNLNCTKFL